MLSEATEVDFRPIFLEMEVSENPVLSTYQAKLKAGLEFLSKVIP